MRIPSGVTDQYIYFVAVDATDLKTRETGLSSFTVYRSRNGGAAVAMTTPTINEVSAANMPGVYELLLDEDMTLDAGDDSQEMVFHITHAGMAPVTRTIELYRPKFTAGETLTINNIADGILDRDMATGSDNGSATVRTVRQALRFLRNKWTVAAGTLTVYKEDDTTASWSSTVSGDATAAPITGSDPAGP